MHRSYASAAVTSPEDPVEEFNKEMSSLFGEQLTGDHLSQASRGAAFSESTATKDRETNPSGPSSTERESQSGSEDEGPHRGGDGSIDGSFGSQLNSV
ncbi:Molybdenum cofactor biosynthesis pathway protein [Klebsormidium nitens]|uniref:Molybdenum cofactor biosynthesis pathway protein n=1 Tax=Klebsormidium nitens TaxID=105231 RepID=A0A1Y1ITJ2_KLENI|nr:Molybdenum cofactor biosynthesis pathway protein [Klebsormidium nitens]|eukprot:GAQ91518.1 Molybdenum cofactor biosynthesis pathway protein [Klebsormidium nitens]